MASEIFIPRNLQPWECHCLPGYGCHTHDILHPQCPVVQRWFMPRRYGQIDIAIAGMRWRTPDGSEYWRTFQVWAGTLIVGQDELMTREELVPLVMCLAEFVYDARMYGRHQP